MSPLSDKQVIAIAEDGARDRGLSVQGLVAFAVLRGQVWEVNFVPAGVNVLGGGVKVMIRASDGAVLDAHISP